MAGTCHGGSLLSSLGGGGGGGTTFSQAARSKRGGVGLRRLLSGFRLKRNVLNPLENGGSSAVGGVGGSFDGVLGGVGVGDGDGVGVCRFGFRMASHIIRSSCRISHTMIRMRIMVVVSLTFAGGVIVFTHAG